MPTLSQKSMERLSTTHPAIAAITLRANAICPQAFQVTDGTRTLEKQIENLAAGKSKTLASTHLISIAVDLHATRPDGTGALWDKHLYKSMDRAMKQAASELGFKMKWGGDWGWDSVHFQLSTNQFGPSIGSKGQAVVNCQRLLSSLPDVDLKVDGHFGMATERAVRFFQSDYLLPVTGVVNYPTLKKLIMFLERTL